MKKHAEIARKLFFTALRAVDPFESVQRRCDAIRTTYQDGGFTRLVAVGFGKAAASMALALEQELGDILESGVFVTKYDHTTSRKPEKFRIFQAGHPVPDENGFRGTDEIMELAALPMKTLVVTLVSGQLSLAPASPFLAAKQLTTDLSCALGADIMN
jgi:glycerate-2-kinase